MNILELIGQINQAGGVSDLGRDIAGGVSSLGQGVSDQLEPAKQAINDLRFQVADKMGMTKEMVDPGDASTYKVIDQEEFNKRMSNIANTASQMRPDMPEIQQGNVVRPQMGLPMNMAPQGPNPYAPVNYGTMQQQPMSGGIGSVPTMEQILRALQSQQR